MAGTARTTSGPAIPAVRADKEPVQANATLDATLERGTAALAARRHDEAEACFRAVIAADPLDVTARQYLGVMLSERRRTDEAVTILRTAAALCGPIGPGTAAVHNNLANALRAATEYEEAESILRELCRVAPDTWEHWHNLGLVLKETRRENPAIAALRRACALAPEVGVNHAVLGQALHDMGRLKSAEAALLRSIELGHANDAHVLTVLGNNYRWLGEMDLALDALRRAYECSDKNPGATSNVAIALTQMGRSDEALEYHRLAVTRGPDSRTWRANLGYAELTAGILPDGWESWEFGLGTPDARGSERNTGVPRWTPSDPGSRVLCYREQGVGDEILFASCLPDLAAVSGDVVYEADSRLVSLFARSFPECEVRPQSFGLDRSETLSDFDRAIPAGSLPVHFRRTADRFPAGRRSYLVADPDRVDRWRDTLGARPGLRVAFAWRSKVKTAERRVEYTNLVGDWEPLLTIPGVQWVSVQYDDCERELALAERKFGVRIHRSDDVDYLDDFEEVSAILTACDLVVAPRNAVAMLAGALGCPTIVMGNRWDWSDLGTDTLPWFPSTELVFRHLGEEWAPVIDKAAARVRRAAAGKDTRPCST